MAINVEHDEHKAKMTTVRIVRGFMFIMFETIEAGFAPARPVHGEAPWGWRGEHWGKRGQTITRFVLAIDSIGLRGLHQAK